MTTYSERGDEPSIEGQAMSHLSIEVGHLYMEDFISGPDRLVDRFIGIEKWIDAAISSARIGGGKVRYSTCFLIDDYFTQFSTPREVIGDLLTAAHTAGIDIDYLAREAGCAKANEVSLASIVESRIVSDPPPGTTGSRPSALTTGWLSNGQRSPSDQTQAMGGVSEWAPPTENGARNHSIFVDVELWDEIDDRRRWSCSFLAATWQLLRLGLLRNNGKSITAAAPLDMDSLPDSWASCPPLWQINPKSSPFSAYQTISIIGSRFIGVEHAVRTIIGQLGIDPSVLRFVDTLAGREEIQLPGEIVDRVGYVFVPGSN